jgi:hypothetical protein
VSRPGNSPDLLITLCDRLEVLASHLQTADRVMATLSREIQRESERDLLSILAYDVKFCRIASDLQYQLRGIANVLPHDFKLSPAVHAYCKDFNSVYDRWLRVVRPCRQLVRVDTPEDVLLPACEAALSEAAGLYEWAVNLLPRFGAEIRTIRDDIKRRRDGGFEGESGE